MIRTLSCLILLNATALAAQAPSITGSWQLSYPAGVRNENGNITVLHGTGVLTVVAQGDSLIGTLLGAGGRSKPRAGCTRVPRCAANVPRFSRAGRFRRKRFSCMPPYN